MSSANFEKHHPQQAQAVFEQELLAAARRALARYRGRGKAAPEPEAEPDGKRTEVIKVYCTPREKRLWRERWPGHRDLSQMARRLLHRAYVQQELL